MNDKSTARALPHDRTFLRLAQVIGALVAAMGILVIVGRSLEWATFIQPVVQGGVAMKRIVAVAITLQGLSLLFVAMPTARLAPWRLVGLGLQVPPLALGLLGLATALFTTEIPPILLGSSAGRVHISLAPGEMSLVGSLNVVLLSLALGALAVRRLTTVALTLLGVVALSSLLVGIAFLLGTRTEVMPEAWFVGMAPLSKLAYLLLAVGGTLVEPRRGIIAGLRGPLAGARMQRRLLPAVIGLPILLGVLRFQAEQAGWISSRIGVTLMIGVLIVVLLALIMLSGHELNQADLAKQQANQRLQAEMAKQSELAARLRAFAVQLSAAEQQERRRVATILHENFQQMLAATNFQLSSALRHIEEPAARQPFEPVQASLRHAIELSRTLAVELAPPELYQLGLPVALTSLAERFRQSFGLTVELDAELEADVAEEPVRAFLFQAVNELLMNVVKHAETDRAFVTARVRPDYLEWVVRDEGVGCPDDAAPSPLNRNGYGIFFIRQRLESLGGTFAFETRTADSPGCTVRLRLPRSMARGGKADSEPTGTAGKREPA